MAGSKSRRVFSAHLVPVSGLAKFMEDADAKLWRLKSIVPAEWEVSPHAWVKVTHVTVLLRRFR